MRPCEGWSESAEAADLSIPDRTQAPASLRCHRQRWLASGSGYDRSTTYRVAFAVPCVGNLVHPNEYDVGPNRSAHASSHIRVASLTGVRCQAYRRTPAEPLPVATD